MARDRLYQSEWRIGAYVLRAVQTGLGAKTDSGERVEYPDAPFVSSAEMAAQVEEARERRAMERTRALLQAKAAAFNAAFERRRKDGRGDD